MGGPAALVERVDVQPAVVGAEAGGPDDRGDPGSGQVELEHGVGEAFRVGAEHACFRLLRQVEAVAGDVGVGLVEQREQVRVAGGDVAREVGCEPHPAVDEGVRAADHRDPGRGELAEVDGVTAVGPAHRDGDVFGALGRRREVPLAEDPQPPDEVAAAIATRRSVVRADGQPDLAAGAAQLVGDLHAGRPRADDEHSAVGQLRRVAVVARVQLGESGGLRNDRRDHRHLEWPGRRDDVARLELAVGGLDGEAGPVGVAHDTGDLHAGANGRIDELGVGDEVVGDVVLRREVVGADRLELQRSAMRPFSSTRCGMPRSVR